MYGIADFSTQTLYQYGNVDTLALFGQVIIKNAMKENDLMFTRTNTVIFIKDWAELLMELSGENSEDGSEIEITPSEATCQIADHLVYSNAHYYVGKEPMSSEMRKELCAEIEKYLDETLKLKGV